MSSATGGRGRDALRPSCDRLYSALVPSRCAPIDAHGLRTASVPGGLRAVQPEG